MKRFIKIFGLGLLVLLLAFTGYLAYRLTPKEVHLALPDRLVSINSPDGQALLDSADYLVDYPNLFKAWEAQKLVSYCGVASGVIVLNAFGEPTNQFSFFNDDTDAVRSRLQVTFGGMSLAELAALLAAHGMHVEKFYGDELTIEDFRQIVQSNLSREGDYLLVNYQREALGQGRVGHISPVGAYNSSSDRVLIMDTASYKYPYTWVLLDDLYAAIQEKDAGAGLPRGLLEVRSPDITRP
jgi:hypothetical protein